MRITRRTALRLGASAVCLPSLVRAQPTRSAAGTTLLQSAMANGRFVTYQPTGLKIINGKVSPTTDESVRADLKVLRPYFDSLITYGALGGAERIPDIAAEQGFRAVVIGVWDFYNEAELANAIAAAKRNAKIVAGVSLGNEMILAKRASWGDLEHALDQVRAQLPTIPLTVTEAFAEFLNQPDAKPTLAKMDFLLANIHPIFEPWFRQAAPANWADFVAKVSDLLARAFAGPILVKETGIPTGPPSLNYAPIHATRFLSRSRKAVPAKRRARLFLFLRLRCALAHERCDRGRRRSPRRGPLGSVRCGACAQAGDGGFPAAAKTAIGLLVGRAPLYPAARDSVAKELRMANREQKSNREKKKPKADAGSKTKARRRLSWRRN